MDCEACGVQIEQRAHGDLPDGDRAALEQHLAHCAGCRSLAALVAEVNGELSARARQALGAIDWRRLDREVALQSFVLRWLIPGFFIGMGLTVTILLARKPPDRDWLALPFAGLWAVLCVAAWRIRGRWLRQWQRGPASGEELLTFYARWLEERMRDTRQGVATCLACGLVIPGLAWLGPAPISLSEHLAFWSAPILLLPAALYLLAVDLPRLKRERRALG